MSAPESSSGEPIDARGAAELARLQQLVVERDLRVQALERTVRELEHDRALLLEQHRLERSQTGLEGTARRLGSRVRNRVTGVEASAPDPRGIPLAGVPVAPGSDAPRWTPSEVVLEQTRPAILADPPARFTWDLELPAGSAIRGLVALRPGAWLPNRGGIDLVVEIARADGEVIARHVTAIDPAGRVADRRWVPWRFSLPTDGGRIRLTLATQVPSGGSPDYAWAVIGDPVIEVPDLPALPEAPDPGRGRLRRRGPRDGGLVRPSIALLMPVHDPDPGLLDRTLASVFAQTAEEWQLCIVDDGSRDQAVRDRLARAAEDPRVRLLRHEVAQNISGATNAALSLADADFVATVDHDDLLAPDAVESVLALLAADPDADMVYTDNDLIAGDGIRFAAATKPDWSPDLLRSLMYTLHFAVYRRALVQDLGGWRSAFDGAQDHDLVLRLSERTGRIRHVPEILYHWRAHAGSAALGELAKPLAYDRGRLAIAEHLERTGPAGARVERLPEAGRYRVRYPRVRPVTVVVPVRGGESGAGLAATLRGLLAALRPDDRVHLYTLGGDATAGAAVTTRVIDELADARLTAPDSIASPHRRVPLGQLLGLRLAGYVEDTVLLLEHAVAPSGPDAIDELAGHVEAGAAAAGGVITTAEGRLVNGGWAFPRGLPTLRQPDAQIDGEAKHPELTVVSDVMAVGGAVAIPASTLARAHRVASLDRLALVGLTLAASEAGGRIVWSPHARFTADDAVAAEMTVRASAEITKLDRGARPDPFWNPLRWPDRADGSVPEAVYEHRPIDLPAP